MNPYERLLSALEAIGAECVEVDDGYEWWSMPDGDDWIDIRITREEVTA